MRTYKWDEYYEKFYDWAESTRVKNLSALTSVGDAWEVTEVILELQDNKSAVNRLLQMAVDAKLAFDCSELMDIGCICDEKLSEKALMNSVEKLTPSDFEELYGVFDGEVIMRVCKSKRLPLPKDLRDDFDDNDEDEYPPPQKKPGFFTLLLAAFGLCDAIDNANSRPIHNGRCNGDCANCPPHYGYRYGRWYYGKNHDHGCEFDGNNGL